MSVRNMNAEATSVDDSFASPTVARISIEQNGPDLWRSILQPIRAQFGSAILAGGAVRDFLLGVPARDLDVFVNVEDPQRLLDAMQALGEAGFGFTMVDHTEYKDAPDFVNAVRGVLDGCYGDIPVQIISRPSKGWGGTQLVANFDFAITQSWFENQLHDTDLAAKDRRDRTVTLCRWNSGAHVRKSYERFARFNERHGGSFALVDPKAGPFADELEGWNLDAFPDGGAAVHDEAARPDNSEQNPLSTPQNAGGV